MKRIHALFVIALAVALTACDGVSNSNIPASGSPKTGNEKNYSQEKFESIYEQMEVMYKTIDSLAIVTRSQSAKIGLLESSLDKFRTDNYDNHKIIRSDINDQGKEISRLKSDISSVKSDLNNLQRRLEGTSSSRSSSDPLYDLKRKVEGYDSRINDLSRDVRDLKDKIR